MKKSSEIVGDDYCSTTYAAKVLGLSVGTVQRLVETNALSAWKTQGGHRRISLQSCVAYQKAHSNTPDDSPLDTGKLHVVVVEDDVNTKLMYQIYFDAWALPLDIVVYSTAIEALLDLPILKPVVLLTDLHMVDMDGFKFINTIREHKLFSSLPIIAITGLSPEAIEERGGLSKDVLVLKKPIDMIWLKGFMEGIVNLKAFSKNS